MAIIETARFLLKKYTSGGDPHPTRAEFNLMIDTLENNSAMFSQGITAARPAAGKQGRVYWDSEATRLYYDDGAAWRDLNPNGGGGAGAKVTPGVNGVEGVSVRSARADHTHRIDLATGAAAGAMAATDKAMLDAATSTAAGNALAKRDANARLEVNTPTTPFHATTKGYVDGLITDTADYVDAQLQAGPEAGVYDPLPLSGFSVEGYIYTENVGGYKRISVDLVIARMGTGLAIPGGPTAAFLSLGNVLPVGARGSGVVKYLPVAISGGAVNAHATLYLNPNGLLQIKAPTAFTMNAESLFSVCLSYLVPQA